MVYKYLHREISDGERLLHLPDKDIPRLNDWKLKTDTFKLEISYTFLTTRVTNYWKQLTKGCDELLIT